MICKIFISIVSIMLTISFGQVGKVSFNEARLVPKMLNYQGYLTDTIGVPITDDLDMTFKIFDAESGGNELWSEAWHDVPVEAGVFSVVLGEQELMPDSVFTEYTNTWLELTLEGPQTLTPRTRITSVGYAYTATYSDTAEYAKNAAADNDWTLTHNVLYPTGNYGLSMRSGNVMHGIYDSTHVNFGIACTTGTSGQDYKYCAVGGGYNNTASGQRAIVGGGYYNTASSMCAFVGGGSYNTASKSYSTVGGGYNNTAAGFNFTTVSGGRDNEATGLLATISGGYTNTVTGFYGTVAGGRDNIASHYYATVAGGKDNSASDQYAFIGGGCNNTASKFSTTVAGGYYNLASATSSTVSGGYSDSATGNYSTIGGGYSNYTSNLYTTIAGGDDNTATGWGATVGGGSTNFADGNYATVSGGELDSARFAYATVGGGQHNVADAAYTTIAGGYSNTSNAQGATIGGGASNIGNGIWTTVGGGASNVSDGTYSCISGGYSNVTNGNYSTIPGGYDNTASGNMSLAAGYKANAQHTGCFVWADSSGSSAFSSTQVNQFRVRATGGIDLTGNVTIRSTFSGTAVVELGEGLDYAEGFNVLEKDKISPGMVLSIDPQNTGKLRISDKPYDTKVAGITAGANGLGSGIQLGGNQFDCNVALAGRVYCNVDATETGVEPGDLLTTSTTPGYAMKVTDYDLAQGAILGKAMQKLAKGRKGQILVLVTLQ
jgi:hypothetical protein